MSSVSMIPNFGRDGWMWERWNDLQKGDPAMTNADMEGYYKVYCCQLNFLMLSWLLQLLLRGEANEIQKEGNYL